LIALDTNILIYAITDEDADGRHQRACDLLLNIASSYPVLPLPVVGEFLNVCRKRKRASFTSALDRADHMIRNYNCIPAIPSDYLRAGTTSHRYRIQYFDALILMVARRAGATLLLSEDMQDGLEVEGIKVVNPFAAVNDALLADHFGSAV
jgi:predicted nucleic acid-binding protein